MPLPRFQRLAEDKRHQLLAIATKEFAQKGFDAASLNEILAASGLGKSSYYYYFEDKEDLYVTCLMEAFLRTLHEVPAIDPASLTARTFWPTFEEYFRALIRASTSRPEELALYRDIPALRARLMPRFQAFAKQMIDPALEFIRRGQALGCVRTDLDAEQLYAVGTAADSALDEVLLSRQKDITPAQLVAHGELVIDGWRRLLVPAAAPPRRKASR
jgi:AcrR family transcriptional regulator